MKIFNTVIDTGGLDSATDNAFGWWYSMVKGDAGSGRPALPPTAVTLFKGGNKPNGKLLPPPTIDVKRQMKGLPQAELYVPNVNRLKDIFNVRLNRREDGPGFVSLPVNVPHAYIAELRAEYKSGDQWTRPQHTANETWDLYIMAYTVIMRFGASDASFSWVPSYYRPPSGAPKQLKAAVTEIGEDPTEISVVKIQRNSVPQARPNQRRRSIRTVRSR